jgi:hypothetical protein
MLKFKINILKRKNMGYKLERKDFKTDFNIIHLFPTIKIGINDMPYIKENFSIEFHFLVFHGRLLFMKDGW